MHVRAKAEERPGPVWQEHFAAKWPAYRQWWLSAGEADRPTWLACDRAMRAHLPELVPLWNELVALAGGSDLAARFLSGYRPPPYLSGCAQAVWLRDAPFLVRNYDYVDRLWEGEVWHTRWRGPAVLGMSDCLWGLLDGINDSGLAVSLAFGGRREVGDGFGIPILLRYVLETCRSVDEAVAALSRVPCHMAYTVTALDAHGAHATVFLSPGARAVVTPGRIATNHQDAVHWERHATVTGSVDRLRVLSAHLDDPAETPERFATRFLEPPTWSDPSTGAWGTLYTAVYRPHQRALELRWPDAAWSATVG